jgi:hypothetical protein
VARKARGRGLVTFDGWDGKWWKRIKVGRAVYSAVTTVYLPWKISIAQGIVEELTGFSVEDTLFGTPGRTRKARR